MSDLCKNGMYCLCEGVRVLSLKIFRSKLNDHFLRIFKVVQCERWSYVTCEVYLGNVYDSLISGEGL